MKVVILAGGMGTRISEESHLKPKPMIEIGGYPILWHIMKIYSFYGFNEFIICCGYKGHMIKEYFMDYYMYASDITIDLKENATTVHQNVSEPWKVTLVDTGLHTPTAGRVLKIRKYIEDESFMLTYGDGVSDVNINQLIRFHQSHGKIATITAAKPTGRWGTIQINEETQIINSFREKAREDQSWVNVGFAIFNKEIFNYLEEDKMLEDTPYQRLSEEKEMIAFKHSGFWAPMDTMRDRAFLEEQWASGHAPWKLWR